MKLFKINETDFEILRQLVKKNNLPTPLRFLVLDSIFLQKSTYSYIKRRVDFMVAMNFLKEKKIRPTQLVINEKYYEKIILFITVALAIEEVE